MALSLQVYARTCGARARMRMRDIEVCDAHAYVRYTRSTVRGITHMVVLIYAEEPQIVKCIAYHL